MSDDIAAQTLRPCPAPWCAADEPEVEVTGYRGMEFVVCGNCGCTGPEGNSPEDAVRLWNERHPEAEASKAEHAYRAGHKAGRKLIADLADHGLEGSGGPDDFAVAEALAWDAYAPEAEATALGGEPRVLRHKLATAIFDSEDSGRLQEHPEALAEFQQRADSLLHHMKTLGIGLTALCPEVEALAPGDERHEANRLAAACGTGESTKALQDCVRAALDNETALRHRPDPDAEMLREAVLEEAARKVESEAAQAEAKGWGVNAAVYGRRTADAVRALAKLAHQEPRNG